MSNVPIVQGVFVNQGGNHNPYYGYQQGQQAQYSQGYNQVSSPPPFGQALHDGYGQSASYNPGYTGGGYNGTNQYNSQPSVPMLSEADRLAMRATPQRKCQDVIWAIFFYIHLFVMVGIIGMGLSQVQDIQGGSYGSTIFLVVLSGLVAIGLSILSLSLMMKNTICLVKTALIFSVVTSGMVGLMALMSGDVLMGVLGVVSFVLGICYAYVVWGRIPFAAGE
jgi:hypothetical protein